MRVEKAPDARNLAVVDIDSKKSEVLTGYDDEDIRYFEWISNERLLFKLDRDYDSTDEANEYLGTYAIDRDGSKRRVLHEPFGKDRRSTRGQATGAPGGDLYVYGFDADDRHIWLAARSDRNTFALYQFDPAKGELDDPVYADPKYDIQRIEAPLLVIHGRLDYNVDIEQYQALIRQLRKHDKDFETMTERYQGHGFQAESASIELHRRIETFLAKHL
ncbi:hypothetical protein BH24PSE2_BH24PSE2_23100 [soil metagenome]